MSIGFMQTPPKVWTHTIFRSAGQEDYSEQRGFIPALHSCCKASISGTPNPSSNRQEWRETVATTGKRL